MRSRNFCIRLVAVWMLVSLPCGPLNADEVTIDDIRTAWESRKQKSERLHIKTSSVIVEKIPGPGMSDKDPVEYRDTEEIWMDGESLCVETLHPDGRINWKPSRSRHVFNSHGIQKLMSPSGLPTEFDSRSFGLVTADPKSTSGGLTTDYFAMAIAYRFSETNSLSFPLSRAEILPRREQVGAAECVVVTANRNESQSVSMLVYVDPARDFVPLRILRLHGSRPSLQVDAEYKAHQQVGYQITAWASSMLDSKGNLFSARKVTVNEFTLPPIIPAETFRIAFPPGAQVSLRDGTGIKKVDSAGRIPGFNLPAINDPAMQGSLEMEGMSRFAPVTIAGGIGVAVLAIWYSRRKLKKGGNLG